MQYAQRHINSLRSAFKKAHRTTLRVEKDRWTVFKKRCHDMGLTTCFVMRSLMENWLEATYRNKVLFDVKSMKLLEEKKGKMPRWDYPQPRPFEGLDLIEYLVGDQPHILDRNIVGHSKL